MQDGTNCGYVCTWLPCVWQELDSSFFLIYGEREIRNGHNQFAVAMMCDRFAAAMTCDDMKLESVPLGFHSFLLKYQE